MKGHLVSTIAIFLLVSLEMMGGAEGKPQPGPQPAPAPQPIFLPGNKLLCWCFNKERAGSFFRRAGGYRYCPPVLRGAGCFVLWSG